MSWFDFKEAMVNPPPERLAKIEYQSHLLQGLGIIAVCLALILKGYWYIIFALIFGVGVSYAQGMNAYKKYKTITGFKRENPLEFEVDISFTRRRSKIIRYVFGAWAKWISIIISVAISVLIVDPTKSRWVLMFAYPFWILFWFVIFYFNLFYWLAYPIYKRRVKK